MPKSVQRWVTKLVELDERAGVAEEVDALARGELAGLVLPRAALEERDGLGVPEAAERAGGAGCGWRCRAEERLAEAGQHWPEVEVLAQYGERGERGLARRAVECQRRVRQGEEARRIGGAAEGLSGEPPLLGVALREQREEVARAHRAEPHQRGEHGPALLERLPLVLWAVERPREDLAQSSGRSRAEPSQARDEQRPLRRAGRRAQEALHRVGGA